MNNILIIGGGSIGKRHLRNLLKLGEKNIFAVEPNEARAREEIEKEYKIKTFRSVEEAFAEVDFNITFICNPSVFHLESALFCADKGCHLFVEKPLSNSMEGVDKLLDLVEEKGLITMLGSNWKFHPLFKKMKEWLDNGEIGKVLSARCQFGSYLPDWHPWEDYKQGYSANKKLGGGVLLESHEFDYITWFLGKAKKIACFADRVGDITVDVEDTAELILQFENKAIGEIHLDYLQRFYQRNFEFFGEKGTIIWDVNKNNAVLRVKDKEDDIFDNQKDYDINDMYIEEAEHFLDCVKTGKKTITDFKAGAEILKLICAAKESAENKTVISL